MKENTTVTIGPDKAKDLKIALLEQQLIQYRGQALLREVEGSIAQAGRKVAEAFTSAGLDPALTYKLDFDTNTAIPADIISEK